MTDTGAGTPLTARLSEALRRTHPRLLAEALATLAARPATDPAGLDEFSMQLQMHIAFCEPGTVHATDPRARCTVLARQFAARSRPAKTPPDPFDPDQRYLEDRPATDPAGLDALRDIVDRCRQHIAGLGADLLTIKAREATSTQRDAAADRAYAHLKGIDTILTDAIRDARLSVADGPGPEERHWPRWECSSCHRNANQCGERGEAYGGACCRDCDHDR